MKNCTVPITIEEMYTYGYLWNDMTPLDAEAAEKMFKEGNKTVYCLYPDNTEGAVDTLEDIRRHAETGGLFGVED